MLWVVLSNVWVGYGHHRSTSREMMFMTNFRSQAQRSVDHHTTKLRHMGMENSLQYLGSNDRYPIRTGSVWIGTTVIVFLTESPTSNPLPCGLARKSSQQKQVRIKPNQCRVGSEAIDSESAAGRSDRKLVNQVGSAFQFSKPRVSSVLGETTTFGVVQFGEFIIGHLARYYGSASLLLSQTIIDPETFYHPQTTTFITVRFCLGACR